MNMTEEISKLKDNSWYWLLLDGYDWYMPCLFMKGRDSEDSCFLPAGLGDSSSMGIYADEIEKIGPEIIAPQP